MALIVSWLQGTDRQCQLLGTGQLKTLSGPFSRLGSGMVTTLPGDDAMNWVLNTYCKLFGDQNFVKPFDISCVCQLVL